MDFSNKSADCEFPTQQLDEFTSADTVTVNSLVQPSFDDEIDYIVKRIIDDESLFDQQHADGHPALPLVCDLTKISFI